MRNGKLTISTYFCDYAILTYECIKDFSYLQVCIMKQIETMPRINFICMEYVLLGVCKTDKTLPELFKINFHGV